MIQLQKYCLRFLIAITLVSGFGQLAWGQGCTPAPCANIIPCAHCAGTWSDDSGAVWTVTSNTTPPSPGTYSVSGTVVAPPATGGCPSTTYQVSGSITQTRGSGTTSITWTASNPSPSGACGGYTPVASETYTGTILNNGCDYATGTWTNSSGSNGNFTASKPPDTPDLSPADSSIVVSWWSDDPTIALYEQTIGSSKYMAGRQVFETVGGLISDTCWFDGSMYDRANPAQAGWLVGYYYFDNRYDYDYIGMSSAAVVYYRQQNKVPCEVIIPQQMNLYTHAGSQPYFSDYIYWNLPDATNYGVSKSGVQAWRTYP